MHVVLFAILFCDDFRLDFYCLLASKISETTCRSKFADQPLVFERHNLAFCNSFFPCNPKIGCGDELHVAYYGCVVKLASLLDA